MIRNEDRGAVLLGTILAGGFWRVHVFNSLANSSIPAEWARLVGRFVRTRGNPIVRMKTPRRRVTRWLPKRLDNAFGAPCWRNRTARQARRGRASMRVPQDRKTAAARCKELRQFLRHR